MILDDVIEMLSNELAGELKSNEIEIIKRYVQMALVYGLEQQIPVHKKRIEMLDKNNNIIKKFDRLVDAVEFCKDYKKLKSNTNTMKSNIWKTLNNQRNISYGYHWKYA